MSNNELGFSVGAESDDTRPLPLIVAKRWGFQLRYVVDGDVFWYSVRDWVAGLSNAAKPLQAWQMMRKSQEMQDVLKDIKRLRLEGNAGSPSQVIRDKGLYQIAANMRPTKNRPALSEIKDFLAKAGVFADLVRRDPEAAELALQQRRQQKYVKQGKTPDWIAVRELGIITRKQLMALIHHLLGTSEHSALITNDTYQGVFGMTAEQLRNKLGIPQSANARDHFSTMALVYTQAAEEACRIQLSKYDDDDIVAPDDIRAIVTTLARHIGKQVKDMEKMLGIDIVTGQPILGTGRTNQQLIDEGNKPHSEKNPFSN